MGDCAGGGWIVDCGPGGGGSGNAPSGAAECAALLALNLDPGELSATLRMPCLLTRTARPLDAKQCNRTLTHAKRNKDLH